MVKNMLTAVLVVGLVVSQVHSADSFFSGSTDRRLMSNVEKLGDLENGLAIYSWKWNETARALDPRYGADGGFISIGFVAQEVAKVYPDTVQRGENGYLFINERELAKADQYIRWKLTSDSTTVDGRCARVRGSSYILCF